MGGLHTYGGVQTSGGGGGGGGGGLETKTGKGVQLFTGDNAIFFIGDGNTNFDIGKVYVLFVKLYDTSGNPINDYVLSNLTEAGFNVNVSGNLQYMDYQATEVITPRSY